MPLYAGATKDVGQRLVTAIEAEGWRLSQPATATVLPFDAPPYGLPSVLASRLKPLLNSRLIEARNEDRGTGAQAEREPISNS